MSIIPPITRNRWSVARIEPKIISPARSTRTKPTPVAISHSQLDCSVPIEAGDRLTPDGHRPLQSRGLERRER